MLHDPEAVLELETARERAGEAAERLAVRVADRQAVLLPAPLALALELQAGVVVEGDRIKALEADRPRLEGLVIHPDRSLGALRRIVDAADQVPGHGAPIGSDAHAG